MENIKLLVAMHKAYCLPEDAVYAPIQVGGVHIPGMENALRDDTGENISNKNKSYCELTALYWGWKNLQADYLGLVHYRRYFARRMPGGRKFDRIASGTEIHAALEKAPVIIGSKRPIPSTFTPIIRKIWMLYRVSLQKDTQPTCRPTQLSWGAPAGIGSICSSCAGTFWMHTAHGCSMCWQKPKSVSMRTVMMRTMAVFTVFWPSGCWTSGWKRTILRIRNCPWCFWKISTGSKRALHFSAVKFDIGDRKECWFILRPR